MRHAEVHDLPPPILEVLLHVLTDNFNIAVWNLAELVDVHVCVVSTKVVKGDWNPETDRLLQVGLTVRNAEEESRDVIVVTYRRPLRIVFFESVAADIALRRVFILFPLLGTYALYRSIRLELLQVCSLPLNKHVQQLG